MPDPRSIDPESLPPGVYASRGCPPLPLLRAWPEQALPPELARDIASHVGGCVVCQALLADLEHLPQPSLTNAERVRIRRKLPLISSRESVAGGWRWYSAAAAAAVLVIAGAILAVRHTAYPDTVASTPLEVVPALTSSPPAPKPPAAEPRIAIPSQIARLDPPLESSSALVLRGDASSSDPTAQQLAPAFSAYTSGNYTVAAQRFTQLAKQFPRSRTSFLYLGVTH